MFLGFKTNQLLFLGILIVGVIFRFFHLSELPSGFHNDEASFFYNAQLLNSTGMDEDGRRWPVFLNSYIDPKPALFAYLQIPFIRILGNSVWAARLPSAFLGIVSLVFIYLLLRALKVTTYRALLIMLLVAISPWHIMVSRATQEVVLSFTLGLMSLWFLLRTVQSHFSSKWSGALLFNGGMYVLTALGAVYAYHSAKIVLPLLVFWLLLTQHLWPKSRMFFISCLGLIIMVTGFVTFFSSAGLDRFQDINVFTKGDLLLIMDEQIKTATPYTPGWVIRIFHNKVVNSLVFAGSVYFQHFTAHFLFFSGGEPNRYDIPFHGLLYWIELGLLALGLVLAFRPSNRDDRSYLRWFFLGWLLVSPLPAVLTTQELPSTVRTFWMNLPLYYFVAEGIWWVGKWGSRQDRSRFGLLTRRFALVLLVGGYLWGVGYFIHQFAVFQPYYHPWNRNYADTQMAQHLARYQGDYERVVISRFSGQPYTYLALEELISPASLRNSYPARLEPTYQIDKYYFDPDSCPVSPTKGVLFVIRENCVIPPYLKIFDKATYRDGNDGYIFGVLNPEFQEEPSQEKSLSEKQL